MIFEELVGRNGHDDLAWLIFDKGGEREHRAVPQPEEQAEENEKSE
jgi:hypothetical protein